MLARSNTGHQKVERYQMEKQDDHSLIPMQALLQSVRAREADFSSLDIACGGKPGTEAKTIIPEACYHKIPSMSAHHILLLYISTKLNV